MWAAFVLCCVSWCFVARVASSTEALQLWKAAEAVLEALPKNPRLKVVDYETVDVYCGQQLQLGLQIDKQLYEVRVSREADWRRLQTLQLEGTIPSKPRKSLTELQADSCLLPKITLTGPLEIEWEPHSSAKMKNPPEEYSVNNVEKLILEDGAHVRLSGLIELQLEEPLVLKGLTSEYMDFVYGRKAERGKVMQGLRKISAALLQEAQRSGTPLKLKARSGAQGFTLTQVPLHPINIAEITPGTINVYPSMTVSPSGFGHVVSSWFWPFSKASIADTLPYEDIFRRVVRRHFPEVYPEKASIALSRAISQAVALLHLHIEVRLEMGPTQMLDAHVLIHDDQYLTIQAHPLKTHQYTATTSSPYHFMNYTVDPDLPLYDMYL